MEQIYRDLVAIISLILGFITLLLSGWKVNIALRESNEKSATKFFKKVRKYIKENRRILCDNIVNIEKKYYNEIEYKNDFPLLTKNSWIQNTLFSLSKIKLSMLDDITPPSIVGTKAIPIAIRKNYPLYSEAIEVYDRPKTFDNRPQYRLLDIKKEELIYSKKQYRYFDKINYGEFFVFQAARIINDRIRLNERNARKSIIKRFRTPSDYLVLSGIDTLTIIHTGDTLRILMHLRGQEETASYMGAFHVIPAGEFQPSCCANSSFSKDFDLWRSIMREYAEEILCRKEYDGNSTVPFSYLEEPYATLEKEALKNNILLFYVGTTIDPLAFQADILTISVFKEETFNKIFPEIKTENSEGKIITEKNRWGMEFTEKEYQSYEDTNILPSARSLLTFAWNNRKQILECFKE